MEVMHARIYVCMRSHAHFGLVEFIMVMHMHDHLDIIIPIHICTSMH